MREVGYTFLRGALRGSKPMKRQQFLAIVEASWQALDAAIAGLDEQALSTPGLVGSWSALEVLGHVTAWEQQALRHIEQWQRGEPLTLISGPAVDDYNAAEYEQRRGWSLAKLRAEHHLTRERLRAAVEALSNYDWATVRALGGQTLSLGELVAGDLGGDSPGDHAAEHAEQILEWRRARQAGEASAAGAAASPVQE
jgi:DinB superfamily